MLFYAEGGMARAGKENFLLRPFGERLFLIGAYL
ncbi:hypothetical protein BOSE21B_50398 [Bosea sp. 21B]|nr:hypothetical protein BOSE21B_50398 [Bosea sp. 21B]CAD5301146.1 hypothetical protein BOSE7B_90292 [Bosea sp. 7B]